MHHYREQVIMIVGYWLVMLIIGAYFIIRRFDIFTLAFLSSCVYFLPAAFPTYPIEDGAYVIYVFVLMSLLATSLISDHLFTVPRLPKPPSQFRLRVYFRGSLLLYLSILVIFISTRNIEVATTKAGGDGGGTLYYALSVLLGYVFIISLRLRSKYVVLLCLTNYGRFVLTGDRTQFVVAALAAVVFFLADRRVSLLSLFRRMRGYQILLLLAIAFVGLFGKNVYGAYYDYQGGAHFISAFESRMSESIADPASRFEPYHVQSILNFAIENDDSISPNYLLWIPVQMLPFSADLGSDVHIQSEAIKRLYFSGWADNEGVSSNFFAEGYLLWGYAGAILFALLYAILLLPFAWLLSKRNELTRVWASFAGVFWAFYIHRSSLFQIISHEKRIIYSIIVVIIFSRVLNMFIKSFRRIRPYG